MQFSPHQDKVIRNFELINLAYSQTIKAARRVLSEDSLKNRFELQMAFGTLVRRYEEYLALLQIPVEFSTLTPEVTFDFSSDAQTTTEMLQEWYGLAIDIGNFAALNLDFSIMMLGKLQKSTQITARTIEMRLETYRQLVAARIPEK